MGGMEAEDPKSLGQDMSASFDLSVIIVNYNVKELLYRCLKTILEDQSQRKIEVVVIDNASSDGSTEMVKDNFPKVKVVVNSRNLGFAKGANQGIKQSQGKYIFLLNPDASIKIDQLDKMIDLMEENREIAICGPKITDDQGNLQYSCRRFPSYLTSISSSQSLLFKLFPGNPLSGNYLLTEDGHEKQTEVDWVSGSGLLARRDILDRIGGLDERFFMYVEDVDLCYRAKKDGGKVFYFPGVKMRHLIGGSTRKEKGEMIVQHHKSMYLFYEKYYAPRSILSVAVLWGIFLRMGVALSGYVLKSAVKRNA